MKKYKYSFSLQGGLKHIVELTATSKAEALEIVKRKILEMFKNEKL